MRLILRLILDRETYEHCSILEQYDKTSMIYRKYYQYDQIKGVIRKGSHVFDVISSIKLRAIKGGKVVEDYNFSVKK